VPRLRLALAASVVLAATAIVAMRWEGTGAETSQPRMSPALVVNSAGSLPSTVDELPATDVSGYRQILAELRGTPVVVNFWASWCDPCEVEVPMLAEAARANAGAVQFIGVDILDARTSAETFIEAFAIPYPSLFDPAGALRIDEGSFGQPVTVFYDRDGERIAKVDGPMSQATLDANLALIVD